MGSKHSNPFNSNPFKKPLDFAKRAFPIGAAAVNPLTPVANTLAQTGIGRNPAAPNDLQALGIVPTPPTPKEPDQASVGSSPDSGPAPTFAPPDPSLTPEIQQKRRLAALRMGLLSTITTSPWGTTSQPNLMVPQAFANGFKTQLGQ